MFGERCWAFIADMYLPILAIGVIFSLYRVADWTFILKRLKGIGAACIVIYGFMLVDLYLRIWPSFDSDYSTHTALSLVFVGYFVIFSKWRFKLSSMVSLIWYCELMERLNYHTYMDMITTSLVVFPLILLVFIKINAL
jgi:hypothetical protein